jgi:ankyrin repeat protein
MPNLHDEINNENIAGVRLLLEQGISGSFSRYGISSLTIAIGRGGNREIIDLLIQHGADVNKVDRSCKTQIMIAIGMGYCDPVGTFLRHGAKVDAVDKHGCTALFYASYEESLGPLMRASADLNHRNVDGRHPLDLQEYQLAKVTSLRDRTR